jgi:hypothetical protein
MWLLDFKLHETFPMITIDREWRETHERSSINITQTYIWKGQSPANKLCLHFTKIKLGLNSNRKGFDSLDTIPMLWSNSWSSRDIAYLGPILLSSQWLTTWGVTQVINDKRSPEDLPVCSCLAVRRRSPSQGPKQASTTPLALLATQLGKN